MLWQWEESQCFAPLGASPALSRPKERQKAPAPVTITLEQCWQSQHATQLTEESITDNCNHVDRTSLDFDMTSYFVKIQKAKKQHLLKYCAATESVQHQQTSRNEAFPYCFVHFIPNFYFY